MADNVANRDLLECFEKVVSQYKKVTKQDLHAAAPSTPQDLEARCNELSRSDRADMVKTAARSVAQVAQFAAGAASSVFPPATIVFTALSALGDTIDHYRGNFTPKTVLDQLQGIDVYLGRMEDYLKICEQGIELDVKLRNIIMDIFIVTMDLCTIYTRVARDSKTPTGIAKNLLKAAIRWDNNMQSKLKKIKDTSDRELNNNVAALRVSDIYMNDNKVRRANSDKLRKYLNERIAKMGDWLLELSEFKSWANIDHHSDCPVLYINAPSGHGKSHLCSQAIQFLQSQQKKQPKISTSVEWYFIPEKQAEQKGSNSKGNDTKRDKTEKVLLDALRALIWQLGESDGTFQDFVVKAQEKSPQGVSKPKAVWTSLMKPFVLLSKEESEKPQKVLFLLLDGYGDMDLKDTPDGQAFSQIIQDISQHCRRRTQFRILLSGSKDFRELEFQNISEISLSRDYQRQDAKHFIDTYLKDSYEHWGSESEGHRTLWGIRGDLTFYFEGNYHNLKQCLQEVERSSQRGVLDMQELQGVGLKDQLIITKRQLETLNNKLRGSDIEVLNEMITCLVYWEKWPTVQQLNAYLSLRLPGNFKPPIEEQLKGKFERLACVENGLVVSHQLNDFFDQGEVTLSAIRAEKKPFDQSCEDIVLVPQCVFESFRTGNPPAGISTDHLGDWLKKHTHSTPIVCFDKKKAMFDTIKFFLRTICENTAEEPESNHLFRYIAVWLPQHFTHVSTKEVIALPPGEKKTLGSMLYKAFMDENIVGTWMPKGEIEDLWSSSWEKDLECVVDWLRDESVMAGFNQGASVSEDCASPASEDCRSAHGLDCRVSCVPEASYEDTTEKNTHHGNIPDWKDPGMIAMEGNNAVESNAEIDIPEGSIGEGSIRGLDNTERNNAEDAEMPEGRGFQELENPYSNDGSDAESEEGSVTSTPDSCSTENDEIAGVPQGRLSRATEASVRDNAEGGKALPLEPLGPVQLHQLLHNPLKVVALQWFRESKWEATKTLTFLVRLFLKAYDSKYGLDDPAAISRHDWLLYKTLEKKLDFEQSKPDPHKAAKSNKEPPALSKKEWSYDSPEVAKAAEKWAMCLLGIPEVQSRRSTTHDLRLADTFMGLEIEEGFEEAERRCELIKKRDPLDIKAQLSLVRALDSSKNRKRQALDEFMKIRHNILSSEYKLAHPETWSIERKRFWALCESTNAAKEAYTACRDLSEEFPEDPVPSEKALEWINRGKKLDMNFEVISMKRKVDGHSLLVSLFCSHPRSEEFHQKFHVAAKDRPRLVLETYEDAIKGTKSRLDTAFLRYHYGMALSRCGRLDDAIKAWEESVNKFQESRTWSDSPLTISKALNLIAEALGSAYLGIILDHKNPEPSKPYIEKLERYKNRIDDHHPNGVNYLALLLARAYKHLGQQQKAVSSVKKHMSTSFDLLEDEREDNDWNGYFMLAEALMALEDDDNARAAWSLIVNVPDRERTCELSITCSGGCRWAWEGSGNLQKDLYTCRNCPHVRFERDCWELLKKDALEQHICGANHSFLTIPRRKRSDVRALESRKVLIGKVKMNIDDWLEGLRLRYGVRDISLAWSSRTAEALQIAKWRMRRNIRTAIGPTKVRRKR